MWSRSGREASPAERTSLDQVSGVANTLFEQCGGGVGWVIVGSGVNVEEA